MLKYINFTCTVYSYAFNGQNYVFCYFDTVLNRILKKEN